MCTPHQITITGDHFCYGFSGNYRGNGRADRNFSLYIDYGTFLDGHAKATKKLIRDEFVKHFVRQFQPLQALRCIFIRVEDNSCKLYIAYNQGNKAYLCEDVSMNKKAKACFDRVVSAIKLAQDCICDEKWQALHSVAPDDLDLDAIERHRHTFASKEDRCGWRCRLCKRSWHGRSDNV